MIAAGALTLGCSSLDFAASPLPEALDAISSLGFDRVDLVAVRGMFDHVNIVDPPADEIDRVADLLAARDLTVTGLLTYPWVPDAIDDADELRRRYEHASALAAGVGAPLLIVDGGAPTIARPDALARWARTIQMAVAVAGQHGIQVAVETPHAGTLAECAAHVDDLLAHGPGGLGVGLDTFHAQGSGATISELVGRVGDRLAHVALGDRRGDDMLAPGEGEVAFDAVAAVLGHAGYRGALSIECVMDGPLPERVDRLARARDHVVAAFET